MTVFERGALTTGIATLVCANLIACSSNVPNSQDSAIAVPPAEQPNSLPDTELQGLGVTVASLGNPFFVTIGETADQTAQDLTGGSVNTAIVSSDYDLNKQINQLEDFIASGANLILLNAADSEGIAPAVTRAKAAGATVIAIDVAAEGGVDATVTSNNVQAGEVACQYIADRLLGQGNVVILNGPPVSAVVNRVHGCKSVLEQYPDIAILSEDQNADASREGGLRVMSDLLTTFPEIDAVFAINDPTGIGAELAAQQAGRNEFFIVGVDGAPEAVDALKQEESLFAATAAQYPAAMAATAVEVGLEILQGNPPAEDTILVPVELITPGNVDQYAGWDN
ncbi:MAG: ABC transporter substrate-binding protein [Cyanobacteria bacterium J06559_3]